MDGFRPPDVGETDEEAQESLAHERMHAFMVRPMRHMDDASSRARHDGIHHPGAGTTLHKRPTPCWPTTRAATTTQWTSLNTMRVCI